jgi:nucleotide-binding universal stress UspA family protein
VYNRILLAYDGTIEGRRTLREGGLLGKKFGAQIFLLAITPAVQVATTLDMAPVTQEFYERILRDGVEKAKELGLEITAKLTNGDPAREIVAYAKEVKADLVVLSPMRKSFFDRWWAGADQTYLANNLACSVLVSRHVIEDRVFNAELTPIAPI